MAEDIQVFQNIFRDGDTDIEYEIDFALDFSKVESVCEADPGTRWENQSKKTAIVFHSGTAVVLVAEFKDILALWREHKKQNSNSHPLHCN